MTTAKDFEQYYQAILRPVVENLEHERTRICRNGVLVLGAAGFVLLAGAVAGLGMGLGPFALILAAALAFGGGSLAWRFLTRDFVLRFKNEVIAGIVRFCDPDLVYAPASCISSSEFLGSKIFRTRIDRYRGEDLFQGTLGRTAVRFSEVHAEHKTETRDSKGHRQTRWETIFRGVFFIADFNKDFQGETIVLPDTAEKLFGFLGRKLQALNVSRDPLIQLEDPEFEKAFVVYGSDQVEARYILSTSLMRRILELRRKTGGSLYLSFVQSRVCVAMARTKNAFEPRIFRTLLDVESMKEYYDDLESLTGIVEDLNLNTRIWSKQ